MNKSYLYIFLLCMLPLTGHAQEVLYSWESPDGTVIETGGTLEHFNQNGRDKRNVPCGTYHAFVLNGDYRYVNVDRNLDDCSYMRITLADGNVFRAGDKIEITAMRNNVADRPASIYFLFHTTQLQPVNDSATGMPISGKYREVEVDIPLIDTNVWNNLGQGKDSTIGGGTETRTRTSFTPSTYTFTVPEAADGAKYVRLTRHDTGNLLYVTRFILRSTVPSGISTPTSKPTQPARKYIKDGRLVIERGGKLYDACGAIL